MKSLLMLRLPLVSAVALAVPAWSSATAAQKGVTIVVPAVPLADALQRIAAQTGVRVSFDPDAVRDLTARPVTNAHSVIDAVRTATRGMGLTVRRNQDGSLDVTNDITVVARRDEAETGVLVRSTNSSSRTGQGLRDQARNTTVISSKLIEQQQALTILDALRNAGGVTVNTGTVQGGNSYFVRGFTSGGIANGMPVGATLGGNAGVSQPIANVERVEVLKGPDALLSGQDNLGGTINIVTKRPFAGELLTMTAETGSFGQARTTIDANQVLNDSKTVSARLIAVAGTADHNLGGYRGNEDYLLAPSIRFKDARTDILVDLNVSKQIFGANPYTFFDPDTRTPVDRPIGRPILRPDQVIQMGDTRLHAEINREVTDWLTVVVRGQHELQDVTFRNFGAAAILDTEGDAFVLATPSSQRIKSDVVDGFLRIKGNTGPFSHILVAGATHTWAETTVYSSSDSLSGVYNLLTSRNTDSYPAIDTFNYRQSGTQFGLYGQYVLGLWKIKLIGGLRRNTVNSRLHQDSGTTSSPESTATTPNYGVVFDVSPKLSFYGSLAYGYSPTFISDKAGKRLPDIRSRNGELGLKWDLFDGKALLNASYFQVRQSNLLISDPVNPGFSVAVPGLQGKGVDINVSGQPLPGWTVQAGFTRTNYANLTPSPYGDAVIGQPRDQYNVYTTYIRKVAERVKVGVGGGVFGRSSAFADSEGQFVSPASRQVDLNAFVTIGPVDLNLGVRNLFDRTNYGITYNPSYLAYGDPRNWRLTASWRFW